MGPFADTQGLTAHFAQRVLPLRTTNTFLHMFDRHMQQENRKCVAWALLGRPCPTSWDRLCARQQIDSLRPIESSRVSGNRAFARCYIEIKPITLKRAGGSRRLNSAACGE